MLKQRRSRQYHFPLYACQLTLIVVSGISRTIFWQQPASFYLVHWFSAREEGEEPLQRAPFRHQDWYEKREEKVSESSARIPRIASWEILPAGAFPVEYALPH